MEKNFLHFMMLIALFIAPGGWANAQTAADADWTFGSNNVKINGIQYRLDTTNKLAECRFFNDYDKAPENFVIPSKVTYNEEEYTVVSINNEDYYYYSQKNTKSITLPSSLIRIGKSALRGYPNVTSITIPEGVKVIDVYAFYDWNNKSIHMGPTTLPEVRGNFTNNGAHLKFYVPGTAFKDYAAADYFEDYCIISEDATVTTVKTGKVDNGELGYIVVGDALPQIRNYSDVNYLVCEEGSINEEDFYAMRQMRNLIKVDLSGLSITELPDGAFEECWQIEEVLLPPTLKTINQRAFYKTGIKSITLPESLEAITGDYDFCECKMLQSIIIPDGVTSLPYSCFSGCTSLHDVTLPKYLESMESYCFQNCDIYSITFPETLKEIPYYGFSGNKNLKTIHLAEGLETIGTCAFSSCPSIESLTTPTTLRTIKNSAFSEATNMATLTLTEGLESIENNAFYGCQSLTTLTLPSSLLFCLNNPFQNCTSLTSIEARSLIPPTVRSYVPTYEAGNIELYVPLWSFQEYMTTPGWLEYQEHTHIITDNLPENIVINKEFEFLLDEETNVKDYTPNIRLLYNTEQIDDGFGYKKYERGNLTISSRSKMDVNNFSMYYSPFAKWHADYSLFYNGRNYDDTRTKYNPNSLINRGEMRAENQTINLLLANDCWQFICFPFDVAMKDIIPVDSKTQWVVRYYDGEKRAAQEFDNTWGNLTADDILEAGVGYVMKCYNDDFNSTYAWEAYGPVEFTVTPIVNSVNRQRLFDSSNRTITLKEYASEFEQNRSWNLIGNPYPSFYDTRFIDTETPFLVWNSRDGSYAAFSPVDDNYILNPGEAFFMQCPIGKPKLTFLSSGRQTYRNPNDLIVKEVKARRIARQANRSVFNIMLQGESQTDRTRVVFNEAAMADYEINRDAAKMMPTHANVSQIWTVADGVRYAINERPQADGIIDIELQIGTAGKYIISIGDHSANGIIYLEDKKFGTTTELTETGYEFEAEAGTIANRFSLTINPSDVTAIREITPVDNSSDAIYNIAGQKVDSNYRGIIIMDGKKVLNK